MIKSLNLKVLADLMHFDNLRKNIWEFKDIKEINLATDER